jgi:L-rhamnose mutarotase
MQLSFCKSTIRRWAKAACLLCLAAAAAVWCFRITLAETAGAAKRPARYGSVIGLREEKIDEYKRLHAAVWPEIARMLRDCNVRNYSIYLRKLPDGKHYLFSYFEYVGSDFQADMARMGADAKTKEWWRLTDPCQKPLDDRKPGEWWASMEEVFHQD